VAVNLDSLAAFIENSDDINVLKGVIKNLNLKHCEVTAGGIKEAIELYGGKKSPANLIIDISKSELAMSDVARLIEVCSPNINIIAIGPKNEVSLYRDLTKIGVYEYLLTPLFSEILERTLTSMLSGQSTVDGPALKAGKIIACMGARGGVGTTFIASNLAAMLASEKHRRVVLVDLDPYFGTLSLNFDIKTNIGLSDAFENPARIDQTYIDRLLTPINERLFILGSEVTLGEKINYKTEGLEELLKYLSKQFHYVIVDVPHFFNDFIYTMTLKANIVLLIMEASLANLRDAGRLLHFIHKEGKAQRSILTMNKYSQYEKSELKINEFEKILNTKVNHTVLYNNLFPMDFLNRGEMMVNEKNPVAQSIRNIMLDILGARQNEEKSGWFNKLFTS
jgi:pilus assembly protein CpaE